jgi:hypothetical protein
MKRLLTAIALTLTATIGTASSGVTIYTDSDPTSDQIRGKSTQDPLGYIANNDFAFRPGEGGSTGDRSIINAVVGFDLPTLAAGETIDSATISFTIDNIRDEGELGDLAVYLLDTANPDATATSLFFESDSSDGTNVLVGQENTTGLKTLTLNSSALTLLESFYGGDETPDQSEVFFRFNNDTALTLEDAIDRYELAIQGGPTASNGPIAATLTINSVPEPASLMLVAAGAALILGRRRTTA